MAGKRKHRETSKPLSRDERGAEVRIIGGTFRGRRLHYHGDQVVRPMKHRTREAIFNLISTGCAGRHAIDLFAGTGALGLEALSRGASAATFIEKHVPTARVVTENIALLGVQDRANLVVGSSFVWAKRDLPVLAKDVAEPWLVFCSPPYAFYQERQVEMLELICRVRQNAPPDSILIVEAELPFDFQLIENAHPPDCSIGNWDVRHYAPAIVGVWHGM